MSLKLVMNSVNPWKGTIGRAIIIILIYITWYLKPSNFSTLYDVSATRLMVG